MKKDTLIDELLGAFKENVRIWICVKCNSSSGQPAGVFREIKKLGYKFEEHSPNLWAKKLYCDVCSSNRTHYKLLNKRPQFEQNLRIKISKKQRNRIIKLLDLKDAITGASITSTPEIDHKTPWERLENDIDAAKLSDIEIKKHFQLLTREHNDLKREKCKKCINTNIRPAFLGIHFWYKGNDKYKDTCYGCGWYDSAKWREVVQLKLT